MKKRKKNKQRLFLPRGIMPVLTGWAILLVLLVRIPTNEALLLSGQGYLSISLEWFLLFCILGMGGLFHAVSRMTSIRIEKGSTKSAKKVVAVALVITFLTGILLSGLLFITSDLLAGRLSATSLSVPALQCLSASIMPLCMMMVLMGGLDGFGFTNTAFMPGFIACIVFLTAGVKCTLQMRTYGERVGALLQNAEFASSYAVMGLSCGFVLAAWTGFLVSVMGWIYQKRTLHVLALHESEYLAENQKNMLRGIIKARLNLMLTFLIPLLMLMLQNLIFQKLSGHTDQTVTIREWGSYTGIAGTILTLPIFAAIFCACRQYPSLKLCFEQRNLKKCRAKLLVLMRAIAVMTIPWAVFSAILSYPLCGMLFKTDDQTAAGLVRIGSFSIVFIGIAAVLACVLWSMRQEKVVWLGIMFSGFFMLLTQFLLLKLTDFGIKSVAWANLLWLLLIILLFYTAVTRLEKVRINWLQILLPPCIGTLISGVVCFFTAHFLGQTLSDTVVCLVSSLAGIVIYIGAETALHGINPRILLEYPGGRMLYKAAHFLRLM